MDEKPEQVNLTDEQKEKIIKFWNSRPTNPPSFRELIDEVLGKEVDSRSKLARALKDFLASRQIVASNTTVYKPKGDLDLTPEQKEFIKNARNVPKDQKPTPVEIARTLFNNDKITPLFQECRTVANEIKRLEINSNDEELDIPMGDYEPPLKPITALARVKKYTKRDLNFDELTPRQKKEVEALVGYLQNYRFISQINLYESQSERDLFESNFIRFTYDKHDLTEEELEQYILLCTDVCTLYSIQTHIKKLRKILDDITDDPEGKISMGLTEAINSAQDSYNECFARQDKLLKNLVVKRSDKEKNQGPRKISMVELVEFVQEEKKRHLLAQLAEERKKRLKDEVHRIKNLDDLVVEVYGLHESEILGED